MKYITKPEKQVEVEAYHFNERCSIDDASKVLPEWLLNRNNVVYITDDSKTLWGIGIIPKNALENVYYEVAWYGDWVVKDKKDTLHAYKFNQFDKKFMEVDEQ